MKNLTVSLASLLAVGLAVAVTPASAGYYGREHHRCYRCSAPKKYDSREVIKHTRDIDRSRVIETRTVIPTKRLIETNSLVVHENEIRNVGTIQHNHTIIDKEIILTRHNVDNKYVNTVVDLVQHKYNTRRIHVVEEREIPGVVRYLRDCYCDRERPLRSYGMARPSNAYAWAPSYIRSRD